MSALFYPCCGSTDLAIALRAFGAVVSSVHGADPTSGVDEGLRADWELERSDSVPHAFEPEGAAPGDRSIRCVGRDNIPRGNGHRHSYRLRSRQHAGLCLPFTWHQYDAVEALRQIDRIAVFFFRRDRPVDGEGSSGIRWLDDTLLQRVLAKLEPNGLFVTDGADMSAPAIQELLWEAPRLSNSIGAEFEAFGRRFRCESVLDRARRPTLVWRVADL